MNTPCTGTGERVRHGRVESAMGARWQRVALATCIVILTCLVGVAGGNGSGSPVAAAASPGPSCKFSDSLASVVSAAPGKVVSISCSHLSASTPYLLVEASLLVAIDPAATPLFTGSVTSVPGLLALIAALPELNATSEAFPFSDSSGALNYNYTIPTSQPTDPNATCPPSTEQLNSGLIGCAVAMIDLSDFKPVTAGTFVLHYANQPFFPPGPTLALSSSVGTFGQTLSLSDAPGATTFWWLSTLISLDALLGGGSGSGPVPVKVYVAGHKTISNAAVTPATYNGSVFTPPKLSGSFVVKGRGKTKVKVGLAANLLGFPLSITATAPLRVHK